MRRERDGKLAPLEPYNGVVLATPETVVACCCGCGGYGNPFDPTASAFLRTCAKDGPRELQRLRHEKYGRRLTKAGL